MAAAIVSTGARTWRALSPDGVVAATVVGGLVVVGAGVRGGGALFTFFASSTLLGRLPGSGVRRQQRGNERDAVQVLANGGVAAMLAAALSVRGDRPRAVLRAGFGGALAAATADTWATEIGSRSRQRPRSIASGRHVPVGVSGGVTSAGVSASVAGAVIISAVMTAGCDRSQEPTASVRRAIALGGVCGAIADSILGATVQEVRFCDRCQEETERRRHECGMTTRPIRGWSWCTNDVVNGIATTVGAATAMVSVTVRPLNPADRHRHRRCPVDALGDARFDRVGI